MNEYILEVNDLCKKYKETMAVNHVNMKIKKGDIYGFIGRNGAGKSTTLKLISGHIFPTSGEIKLFGEERNSFTNKRIGALIENAGLYSNLSAFDNMDIKATGMGLKDKSKINEILELVKLDPKSTVTKISKIIFDAIYNLSIDKNKIIGISLGVVEPIDLKSGTFGSISNFLNKQWSELNIKALTGRRLTPTTPQKFCAE